MPSRPPTLKLARVATARVEYAQPAREPGRRALATNDARWRAMRTRILKDEPLCRECSKHGRIRAASHVDHVDGNAMNNAPDNLQPLCPPCHSRKTAREDGGWGNRKKTCN